MYVDLKSFRFEHNKMYQRELGEILGIEQTALSRMEKQFAELTEVQYKKLCERFGEEDVQKYVGESPVKEFVYRNRKNVLQPKVDKLPQKDNSKSDNQSSLINSLYKTVERQSETISILTRTIEQLIAQR